MPAYVIVDIDIRDLADYTTYRLQSAATVTAYGGTYLARGGAVEVLEGGWEPTRVVIIAFSSVEQAQAWWDSPEYNAIKPIRQRSTATNMIIVEGYMPESA
jgi:uncharacterized protein (DUF1330 family)